MNLNFPELVRKIISHLYSRPRITPVNKRILNE